MRAPPDKELFEGLPGVRRAHGIADQLLRPLYPAHAGLGYHQHQVSDAWRLTKLRVPATKTSKGGQTGIGGNSTSELWKTALACEVIVLNNETAKPPSDPWTSS